METIRVAKDEVRIRLTYDEALVLSDLQAVMASGALLRTTTIGRPASRQARIASCAPRLGTARDAASTSPARQTSSTPAMTSVGSTGGSRARPAWAALPRPAAHRQHARGR